jgi:hypothetical protein
MLRILMIAAALLVGAGAPAAPAQDQMTTVEEAAVQQALNRGTVIYAYDQAAWHGTDDMVAKIPHPEEVVGGWIVDGPAASPELVFFDKNEAAPHAVYVADFKDNKLVSSRVLGAGDDSTLSSERLRMITARDIAIKALLASNEPRCKDKPYNTVVLPPETPGGPMLVYLLTPQTSNDSLPFGGHYLTLVSADGKAGPFRHFAKSCAEFPINGDDKSKGKAAFLIITHLLDPTPTEIHVFSSLSIHKPIFVFTANSRIWSVEGPGIRLVDSSKAKKSKAP